jgi:aminocarboxymuconate-semialdehyde decarboxylase
MTWENAVCGDATDIHTHIVPADFPAYGGRRLNVRWPQMEPGPDCRHRNVMISGDLFRTVNDEAWDIDRRLESMAKSGITRQVLSPMPELLSYWLEPEDTLALARYINDSMARMVARAPTHFAALATVPLQDPDLAARELEHIMGGGLFRGVEIATHVNGTPIGDPRFAPFFAAAEALGAAVFVHALHPLGRERLVGPPVLANIIANPCETALSITSLITGGVIERHPNLRLAFSHGGGAFAMVLPRFAHFWEHMPEIGALAERSPRELARTLYYDTLTYDPDTLKVLVDRFGVTQLCIGTDEPFNGADKAPLAGLAQFSAADQTLLRCKNAERFLGEA